MAEGIFCLQGSAVDGREEHAQAIAPWLAARLLASSVIAMGNLQTNPNQPGGDRLLDVIENLVIDRWPEFKSVWLGFSINNGTPEFRADKLEHVERLFNSQN